MNRFGYSARMAMAAWFGLMLATQAQAQADSRNPALGPPGAAATRSVAAYLALERTLQAALAGKRTSALETMVDPDFELRLPTLPDTLSRADWFKGGAGKVSSDAVVRDLTVRETGELALVSFLLETRTARYFVVDVWRQPGAQLQARFIAPAASAAPRPRKPSGRE